MRRPLALALLVLAVGLPAGAGARAPAKGRPAAGATAERIRAYEEARADLFALEADAKRRRFRHHWLNLAKRFDRIGDRRDHPRRCEALFNGGRLYAGLAELSYLDADRREAVKRYRLLARNCPKSSLADDALVRAAELLARGDPAGAREELDRVLRTYPKGDMVSRARELAATLKERDPRVAERARPPSPATGTSYRVGGPAPAPAAGSDTKDRRAGGTAVATASDDTKRRAGGAAVVAASDGKDRRADGTTAAAASDTRDRRAGGTPAPGPEAAPSAEAIVRTILADAPAAPSGPGGDRGRAADPADPPAAAADRPPADPALDLARLGELAALERSANPELSLSTVAGLKVRRVVIDPGHGGSDPGAIGKGGTRESTITLAIAKKLKRRLEGLGLEVLLTREDDSTVSLESRTAFANERRADLFLSIHCNAASNRKLRGVETYTLNLNSDRYAMRLAARENAGSERTVGELEFILADLTTKANTDDSVRLAGAVHRETVSRLAKRWDGVKDLGTKQALFFVLLGAKMPAILFEASFLSHPEEEKRLRTDAYQEAIAEGIAAGVARFISDREAIARAPTLD